MSMYFGIDGIARKIKNCYIGIKEGFEEVMINNSNLTDYFDVSNDLYGFIWNDTDNAFVSNNSGIQSSTATSTWTALYNLNNVNFNYSYSSESSYDKFTLIIAGNTIANAVSGNTTIKSWSGNLSAGDTIQLIYSKDSSQNSNDDKCKIYDINFLYEGENCKDVARKIKKVYIGIPIEILTNNINIDSSNILSCFDVSNNPYAFIWNDTDNAFVSSNIGVDSSTASSNWTALHDCTLSFDYSYSSESGYDKFTLIIAGNTIANAVSGNTTIKSWSGNLSAGDTIQLTYTKDSSQAKGDDKCKIYNIILTSDELITITKGIAKCVYDSSI